MPVSRNRSIVLHCLQIAALMTLTETVTAELVGPSAPPTISPKVHYIVSTRYEKKTSDGA